MGEGYVTFYATPNPSFVNKICLNQLSSIEGKHLSHLGSLEHAEISEHIHGSVRYAGLPVQLGSLLEAILIRIDVSQDYCWITVASSTSLLEYSNIQWPLVIM